MALVGGGDSPKWPKNKVIVWDDLKEKIIGELSFNAEIKSVRINRAILIVILFCKTYIFNFTDLTLIDCLDTYDNPTGIIDVVIPQNNDEAVVGARSLHQQCLDKYNAHHHDPRNLSQPNKKIFANESVPILAILSPTKGFVRLRKM